MDEHNAKELLANVAGVFCKYEVKLFLQCGTALGAHREKGFIPGDKDIDLGVLYEEVAGGYMDVIAGELRKFGYKVTTVAKPLAHSRVIKIIDKTGLHCDVAALVFDGGYRVCQSTLTNYALVMPDRLYKPGKEIDFYNIRVFVPDPIEEYLVLHYGEGYMTPKPKDSKSRCRVYGYRLGSYYLARNHSTEHLNEVHVDNGRYKYLNMDEFATDILQPVARVVKDGNSILDIGCGIGSLARFVGDKRYHGIDGSEIALEKARKYFKGKKNISFELARIEDYPLTTQCNKWGTLVFGGIFLTMIKPYCWIEFVNMYANAFDSNQFIICDLHKLHWAVFRKAFKIMSSENVSVKKPTVRYNPILLNRHVESYEL